MPSIAPDGRPLLGATLALSLVQPADATDLHAIIADPRSYADGYAMTAPSPSIEATRELIETRLRFGGGHTPYLARLRADGPLGSAGQVVGWSAIGDVDLGNERAHIGWTMWGAPWWETAVNPEAKLLMLGHCFEDCGFGRVKIQTDAINTHSATAIAKLGASREGVLRRHTRRSDGSFRDTVVFSILADEWSVVRARLQQRLADLAAD